MWLCSFNFRFDFFTFDKIDQNFPIEKYEKYWNLIYIGGCLILLGYSFAFGHHYFNLIYYPIAYEISPHDKKNRFYVNNSGTIIENKENMNSKFKYSKRQKLVYSLLHKN